MKILMLANQQARSPDGYRHTRWAVVRNTAPQLRDTTLKTWFSWFPNGSIGYWRATEKVYYIQYNDVRAEVLFRALDDPDDVRNLLSLELTGSWFNECREIAKDIVEAMDGRIGRFPAMRDGGPTWAGMFGDTNPPEEYSYWYNIFEGLDPETGDVAPESDRWDVYAQPSGLAENAENLEWLPKGYYEDLARGKTKDFIRVNVEGRYGRSKAGKAVHPTFDETIHVAKDKLIPNPRQILVISADFGLTPAMTLKQQNPFGQVLTFDEVVTENMGLERCINLKLKPLLRNKYDGFDIRVTGDPAGNIRSQNDERSCVDIFKKSGFKKVKFAWSNSPVHRTGATDTFLTRITENGPAFLIDPGCHYYRRGLAGGYHYPVNTKGEVSPGPKKNIYSHVCESGHYGDMYFERGHDTVAAEQIKKLIQANRRVVGAYSTRV
jgi:hypothetical protein